MGAPKGHRYNLFMNPKVCPRCQAPATTVFGARRYCEPCAEEMGAFIDRITGTTRRAA